MGGFLSESTRDWLAVGGTLLAVLQTVLAVVALRTPRSHAPTPGARHTPRGLRGAVARLAVGMDIAERDIWLWILGIWPGVTLVALGLFVLAPLPQEGSLVRIEDDGGVLVVLAQGIQCFQGIVGFALAWMLVSPPRPDGDAAIGRGVPLVVLLILGAVGGVSLHLALHVVSWADLQPVSVMTRLICSTAKSFVFPAMFCLLAVPMGIVMPVIERWVDRPDRA